MSTATVPANERIWRSVRRLNIVDGVLPIGTIALMVWFSIASPYFLTPENLRLVATQNSTMMIVAVAAAIAIMSGYVDLSVGSILAFSAVMAGLSFSQVGVSGGIVVGLLVGLVAGLVNGLLIGYIGMSPLVVTLGMMAVLRGAAVTAAPRGLNDFPASFGQVGSGDLFGLSYLVWVAIAAVVLGMVVMNWLPAGKHVIAIGTNPRAAFLNGIKVRRTVFILYALVGLACGAAGVLTIARFGSAPAGTLGLGFEVTVLTAVLLGSIPFTGGRGSLWRVVVAVWLMGILQNGITLLNFGSQVADLLSGVVLIIAAGLEALRAYLNKRSS